MRLFRSREEEVYDTSKKLDPCKINWGTDKIPHPYTNGNPEQFQVQVTKEVVYDRGEETKRYLCGMRDFHGTIWIQTGTHPYDVEESEDALIKYLENRLNEYREKIGIPDAKLKIVGKRGESMLVRKTTYEPIEDDLVSKLEEIK